MGSPPIRTFLDYIPWEKSRSHPYQMSEPTQLALLDVEEKRLYSESLVVEKYLTHLLLLRPRISDLLC